MTQRSPEDSDPIMVHARLNALYPGRIALLLTELCDPGQHKHMRHGTSEDCKSPGKVPLLPSWNSRATDRFALPDATAPLQRNANLQRLATHLANGGNVGLVVPEGMIILDADTSEAVKWLQQMLPDNTPCQQSARGRHYVCQIPDGYNYRAVTKLRINEIQIDLRIGGRSQVAVEPSVHASGSGYRWRQEIPEDLNLVPVLPLALASAIRDAASEPSTGQAQTREGLILDGDRHNGLYRAAADLRGEGLEFEEIHERLIGINATRVMDSAGTHHHPLSDQDVLSTARSAARQPKGTRGSDRANFDSFVSRTIAKSNLKVPEEPEEEVWETPVPLVRAHGKPMPTHCLPEWMSKWVEAEATFTQTPDDLPGTLALAALSGAVAGKFDIEVKPGYQEPLNIFVSVVMPPGSRKSQVVRDVMKPYFAHERELSDQATDTIAEATAELAALDGQMKKLLSEYKKLDLDTDEGEGRGTEIKQGMVQGEIERAKLLAKCDRPRLVCSDVTPEELAVMMSKNNERMTMFSAEGGGFFEMARGRYSANSRPNIEIYLSSHACDPCRIDRRNAPPVILHAPTLTMVHAMQPDVLSGLRDADAFRGRGLLARFNFVVPRSGLGTRDAEAPPVPPAVRDQFAAMMNRALLIEAPERHEEREGRPLTLTPEAGRVWSDFFSEVEGEIGPEGRLEPVLEWASKLPGLVARLAGVLHAGESVTVGAHPETASVERRTVLAAIELGRWLTDHTLIATVGVMSSGGSTLERRLVRWLAQHGGEVVKVRDVQRGLGSGRVTADEVREALLAISYLGYVREPRAELNGIQRRSGRPAEMGWEVHHTPQLWDIPPEK